MTVDSRRRQARLRVCRARTSAATSSRKGNYDILGPPRTDGYDAIQWISTQPWSNGKVGLIGCSSTAEWQMGVAATAPPGLATIIPEGFGAGVGRVKPYYEHGQLVPRRRGPDAVHRLALRRAESGPPDVSGERSQEDLIRESKSFDLAAAAAARRLAGGVQAPAGARHHQGR